MGVNVVRVDVFDDFGEITQAPNALVQYFISHPGVDQGHFVWVNPRLDTVPCFRVYIREQGPGRLADGRTQWIIDVINNDSKQTASFGLNLLVAPSLG
jgi:hypothetical protein